MRVVNERWNELENELGLGLPLNTLSEVDIANKWRLRALNAEKLLNQPQLTIPKSIADELDKVEMNWNTLKDEAQGWPTDDLIMWLDDGNNPLMFAYLAGKAIGVDLVKVGEG
jgi:hypothetical protein